VTEPLRRLAESGFALDLLPVDTDGCVQADALPGLLRPDTRLSASCSPTTRRRGAAGGGAGAKAGGGPLRRGGGRGQDSGVLSTNWA